MRWRCICAMALGLAAAATAARAEFPDKPVRFILGFSPGGGVDIQARIVGDVLQKRWGQTIVIESRAGANGSIAAEFVSRAAPDGYTVVWVSNAHTATPSLLKLNYDAIKSFAPITQVTRTPDVLVVHRASRPRPCRSSSRSPAPSPASSTTPAWAPAALHFSKWRC